jgi:hypothetical protein
MTRPGLHVSECRRSGAATCGSYVIDGEVTAPEIPEVGGERRRGIEQWIVTGCDVIKTDDPR